MIEYVRIDTFPNSWRLSFWDPKISEYRLISGVAAETKLSVLMPRFFSYHAAAFGIDFTVRTRWSSDVIVAAGGVIFLRAWTKVCVANWGIFEKSDGRERRVKIGIYVISILRGAELDEVIREEGKEVNDGVE